MADNVELNLGSGGKTIATDDIGGIQHELIKVEFGTDGNATMVSASNPLPVTDNAAEVSVASIDLKTPTVGQKAMAASSPVVIASDQSAIPISGNVTTGGLTDAQLRAAPVPVSGTFFQATQPVSAAALPLPSGASTAALQTQPGVDIGDVTVNNAAGAAAVNIQDGGNSLTVDGTVAIGAGSAVIGHVIADTGSTTAVTGNVTVIQGTASNLHVAATLDAETTKVIGTVNIAAAQTIAVTQATASSLKAQVASTQKPSYGATVVLAVTALQSMASSATVGWGSVRVSNLATLATDYEIMVKLTTANTAPANDKCMYVFLVPWYTSDAGTTWFPSSQGTTTLPSGTDAAATIASPNNLRLLGVLNYTTAQAVVQDTFLLSNCFGNRMPDAFSLTIINFSGAALSTGCICDYSPINDILI